MISEQSLLPLSFEESFDRHNFHVGESNVAAVRLLQTALQQKVAFLLIHGSSGCGKSHLARVVAKQLFCTAQHPSQLNIAQDAVNIVVDQLDDIADDRDGQETLVHCINRIRFAEQGRLVVFSQTHPGRWLAEQQLPDCISRINGLFQCGEIAEPDDALLRQILLKLADDQRFSLPNSVINYWLARMPRSYAAAQGLIQLLDQITLARQTKVSVVTARQALEELQA